MSRAALFLGLAVAFFCAHAAAGEGRGDDVFHTASVASADLAVLPQWRDTLGRIRKDLAAQMSCPAASAGCAPLSEVAWRAQIAGVRSADPGRKLFVLNSFVNSLMQGMEAGSPRPGQPWPSVAEALAGKGGALGAAILKYVSLRDAGFPVANLRIAMVQDVLRGDETTVLLARSGGETYVLDTTSNAVREARRIVNLIPYYSFNETTLWIHIPERQQKTP